jgi:hypothetical protein
MFDFEDSFLRSWRNPDGKNADEDSFLRDCRHPDVKNADNEWLGAVHAGPFTIGHVEEVNGAGGEEVPFIPTRHESIQLVKHWARRAFDIEFWWFVSEQYGSTDLREHSFAWRRIERIASAIGELDVRKAIDEAGDELGKQGDGWRIFLRGSSEEKDVLKKDFERQLMKSPGPPASDPSRSQDPQP